MIKLSSASENALLGSARPRLAHWLITTAFRLCYWDLQVAQTIILGDPSLCHVLLVQPNALVEEEASGVEISAARASKACS
jgi:hypothetical protein